MSEFGSGPAKAEFRTPLVDTNPSGGRRGIGGIVDESYAPSGGSGGIGMSCVATTGGEGGVTGGLVPAEEEEDIEGTHDLPVTFGRDRDNPRTRESTRIEA